MGKAGHAQRSRLATGISDLVGSAGLKVAVAEGVRRLLGADIAVALTGAGGPDGQDGQPPGTAFLALSDGLHTQVEHHFFDDDDPAEVCDRTAAEALQMLLKYLSRPPGDQLRRR